MSELHRSGGVEGAALMVGGMLLFSLSDVAAKRLHADGIPVLEIAWFRYVALALSLVAARLLGVPWKRSTRPTTQVVRALCVVGAVVLFIAGVARLHVATATALVFLSPLFVTALSVLFLNEAVSAARWGWVALGFAGVVVVAQPNGSTFDLSSLFPMASAAAWAAGMVLTRRLAADDSTVTTQAYSAAVGLGVLTLVLPLDVVLPGAPEFAWLAVMALCWTGAQWLVVAAYGRHPPPSVAPFAYSQLVWATLLGTAFSQQWPTAATLFGAAIIVVAGVGAARATSRPRSA